MGKTLQLAIPVTVFVGEKVRLDAVVFKENGQPATLTPNGGIWFEVTDGQLEPFTTVEPDIGLVAQEWVAPNQPGVVSITAYYCDPVSYGSVVAPCADNLNSRAQNVLRACTGSEKCGIIPL